MTHTIRLNVNGKEHPVEVSSRRLLVDCLRYDLGLTGTKGRMQRRRLRSLHGSHGWKAHQFLPGSGPVC